MEVSWGKINTTTVKVLKKTTKKTKEANRKCCSAEASTLLALLGRDKYGSMRTPSGEAR